MSQSQQKNKGRFPGLRKHATGQAFVRLNGKNVYLGKHGCAESRTKYDRVIGEWLTAGRAQPSLPRTGPRQSKGVTVDQLLAEFLTICVPKKYYRDGKPTKHVASIKEAIPELRMLYGETQASDFGSLELDEVRSEMIRCRKTVSQSTITKRLGIVRNIFKWGVARRLVGPEVMVMMEAAAGLAEGDVRVCGAKDVKPVSRDIVDETLRHASRQVRALAELQWHAGPRPSEVVAISAERIDRSGDCLPVRESQLAKYGPVWIYQPLHHKNKKKGKKRFVYLGERAQAILTTFLDGARAGDPAVPLFSPKEAELERQASRHSNRKSKVQPSQEERARLALARSRGGSPKRPLRSSYTYQAYAQAIKYAIRSATAERRRVAITKAVLPLVGERVREVFQAQIDALPKCMDADRVRRRIERSVEKARRSSCIDAALEARLVAVAVGAFEDTEPVPHWHPYQLRHSFGTRMCKIHGIEVTRILMGHSSIRTTELYAEIDHEKGVSATSESG